MPVLPARTALACLFTAALLLAPLGCEPADAPDPDPDPTQTTASDPDDAGAADDHHSDAPPGPRADAPTNAADTVPPASPDATDPSDASIDMQTRLADIRHLRGVGRITEAFRQARLLRSELRSREQFEQLKPLLDRLRAMDRQVPRLELAIERLADPGPRARVAQQTLREGGRTAELLLARAVRRSPDPTARPAAELLVDTTRPLAATAIITRINATAPDARKLPWLTRLEVVAGALPADVAADYYAAFRETTGELQRAYVNVLDAYAARVHDADPETFNTAIGVGNAFGTLQAFAKATIEAGDTETARWASRELAAFVVFPRQALALHLPPSSAQLTLTEANRLARWSDLSGNDYHAVQPDDGRKPAWRPDADRPAVRFGGGSHDLAIRGLAYDEQRRLESVTIMAWVRAEPQDNASIIDFDRSEIYSLGVNFGGNVDDGHVSWSTTDANNNTHDMGSATRIDDGQWRLILVTYDADTGRKCIYIDGKLDSETTAHEGRSLGNGARRFGFIANGSEAEGFNGADNNSHFIGDIAEIAVWHRRLPDQQLKHLAASRQRP